MADAAGDEPNQDLVGARRVNEDIAEHGGFAGDFEQHCAGLKGHTLTLPPEMD